MSATTKRVSYAKMDLEIVKYFFEVETSDKHVIWKDENIYFHKNGLEPLTYGIRTFSSDVTQTYKR